VADTTAKIQQHLRNLTIRRDPSGRLLVEDIWFERFPFAGQKSLEAELGALLVDPLTQPSPWACCSGVYKQPGQ